MNSRSQRVNHWMLFVVFCGIGFVFFLAGISLLSFKEWRFYGMMLELFCILFWGNAYFFRQKAIAKEVRQ